MKYIFLLLIIASSFSCVDRDNNNSLEPLLVENIGDISSIMLTNKLDTIVEVIENTGYHNYRTGDTLSYYVRIDSLTIFKKNKSLMCCSYVKKYDDKGLIVEEEVTSDYTEEIKYNRVRVNNFITTDIIDFNNGKVYNYKLKNNFLKSKVIKVKDYPTYKDSTLYYFMADKLEKTIQHVEDMPSGELVNNINEKQYFWKKSILTKIVTTTSFINNNKSEHKEILTFNESGFPDKKIMISNSDTLLISKFHIK